jgi:hypothetical protein
METLTIPCREAQPGDVLHIKPNAPNLKRIVTTLYALDANTIVLHLEGLGAHKFDHSESITVDRLVQACSTCHTLGYPASTLVAAAKGDITVDPTPTHLCRT